MSSMQSTESLRQQTKARRGTNVMPPPELLSPTAVDAETAQTTGEDTSLARRKILWRWGVLAAVAMALLSLYPQLELMITRGSNWQGSYTSLCYDEEEYAAYIQGLLIGRPRRHEPYGFVDPNKSKYETFLSIQIVPAYVISSVARVFGLTAVQAFILLTPLTAFFATLAIFYLLASVTREGAVAAAGALAVLILGTLAARHSAINQFFGRSWYGNFLFLRRYQPAVAFPIFFAFITFIWQAFTKQGRQAWHAAIAAGLTFSVLIYAYFFLWTSAVAWLACLILAWLAMRRTEWLMIAKRLAPTAIFGGITFVFYGLMLAHRDPVTDEVQILNFTHNPDFFRAPQFISLAAILLLAWLVKAGRLAWRDPAVLLTISFALMPFAVFNQQIITGRSLQPVHYEMFSANYLSLLAIVLILGLLWRKHEADFSRAYPSTKSKPYRQFRQRWGIVFAAFTCLVLGWGVFEMKEVTAAFKPRNLGRDMFMPVAKRLTELAAEHGKGPNDREMVFSPDIIVISDSVPAFAPQLPFWGTDVPYASGLSIKEQRERYFQYLYYSGTLPGTLGQDLANNDLVAVSSTFGYERYNPTLTHDFKPLSTEEISAKVNEYRKYINTFDRERASHPALSYVVVYSKNTMDFTNLNKWYVWDKTEQIGPFTLYQVRLKAL